MPPIIVGGVAVEMTANTASFVAGTNKARATLKGLGRELQGNLSRIGDLFAPLGSVGAKLSGIFDALGGSARGAFAEIGKSGWLLGGLAGLTGGVAAAGGAILALAEKSATLGAKIHDASLKTGLAAGSLSGMMAITREVGGDFEGLTTSLARASVNLQKTAEGAGKLNPLLFNLMGGTQGVALNLKPMGDEMHAVLGRIFALGNEYQRNEALSQLLSRGWMGNVEALKAWAESADAGAGAAKRFGIYFNDDTARQAKQLTVEWTALKNSLSGFGATLGREFIDPLRSGMLQLVGFIAMLEELQKHIKLSAALFPGGGLAVLAEAAKNMPAMLGAATQAMTDFRLNSDRLTAGAKGTGEALGGAGGKGGAAGAVGAYAHALADLVARQRDELEELDIAGRKEREAAAEYDRTIREIHEAVAAHGSLAEAYQGEALALDIYYKKLAALWPLLAKLPKEAALAMPAAPTGPAIPEVGAAPAFQTIGDLANARTAEESLTSVTRALRMEENLSTSALAQLAKAFSGLTPYQIAASAQGENMIRWLTRLDRAGATMTFADKFKDDLEEMRIAGEQFGASLANILTQSIGRWGDEFARMVVTGKSNFRKMFQGIEEELVKSTLQRGVSSVLGIFGIGGHGGMHRDGARPTSALYVTPVNDSGEVLGKLFGGGGREAAGAVGSLLNLGLPGHRGGGATGGAGGAGGPGGFSGANALSNFTSIFKDLQGEFSQIFAGLKNMFSGIGGLFGGFLQEGGDVSPGRAYLVGERHPEWFLPGRRGAIVPSLAVGSGRSLAVTINQHITTPDADSFRRSQSQITSEAYRATALAHARNS
jgi:hypothetical protein